MLSIRRLWLSICALLLAAGLVGCGGGSPPQAVDRLPGRWHGEMIVYEETVQGRLPPEAIAELMRMQMDFEFRPDGSMALSGVNEGKAYTTEGRWKLLKQEGELLTIQSTEQSGSSKDINIEFDGSDAFYIPLHAALPGQPEAEVTELGALRFTRLR
jgi:hypothetical protein